MLSRLCVRHEEQRCSFLALGVGDLSPSRCLVALLADKQPALRTEWNTGWLTDPAWMFWRKEKCLAPGGKRTTLPLICQLAYASLARFVLYRSALKNAESARSTTTAVSDTTW
jgi:hypothetical protein